MTIKSLVLASACLLFGTAFAADNRSEVIEINDSLAPEAIESGLFPKSPTAADCAEAAKAGFTCGQIVPRKVFSLPASISFGTNSSELSAAARNMLAGFGPVLKRNEASGNKVVFVGHTDITGSRALNMRLSQRRAESVRQYFIREFDISPSFVGAIGVGPQQLKDKQNPASAANQRGAVSAARPNCLAKC